MALKLVYGLSGKTPADKVEQGEGIEAGLTNNNLIPNADLMKQLIHDKTAALSAARGEAKRTHSLEDYAAARQAELEYNLAVQTAGMFVQGVADKNSPKAEQIILSAGYKTRKKPESQKQPEAVSKIEAVFTNQPGTFLLKWKNAKYARYYEVYMSTDPAGEWKLLDSIEGRQMMVKALSSGTRYYFRVVSRNRTGKSAPSQIVSQLAS